MDFRVLLFLNNFFFAELLNENLHNYALEKKTSCFRNYRPQIYKTWIMINILINFKPHLLILRIILTHQWIILYNMIKIYSGKISNRNHNHKFMWLGSKFMMHKALAKSVQSGFTFLWTPMLLAIYNSGNCVHGTLCNS